MQMAAVPPQADGGLQTLSNLYVDLKKSSTPDETRKPPQQRGPVQSSGNVSRKRGLAATNSAPQHSHQLQQQQQHQMQQAGSLNSQGAKKKRFTWSDDLHRQFMATIFDVGLQSAKPKVILQNMPNVPPNLTTEHIKSHLQKYRSNCKRTRDLFMEQFQQAKLQAERFSDGKALNPSFHAYPMPVGPIPLGAAGVLDASDGDSTGYAPHYDQQGSRQNFRFSTGGGSSGYGNTQQQQQQYGQAPHVVCHSCHTHLGGGGSSHHSHMHSHAQPQQQQGQKDVVFEQMEVQMRIHEQIQQQHEIQQSKNQHADGSVYDTGPQQYVYSSSSSSTTDQQQIPYSHQQRQQRQQQRRPSTTFAAAPPAASARTPPPPPPPPTTASSSSSSAGARAPPADDGANTSRGAHVPELQFSSPFMGNAPSSYGSNGAQGGHDNDNDNDDDAGRRQRLPSLSLGGGDADRGGDDKLDDMGALEDDLFDFLQ